ncbi:helix-turn-helix domain-containing protein [Actinomadura sp. SCN-SB]|uniref:helix-turn-helix domain-containing protein n=1 Tax=Actinomadura sp. SCN-SB TaxID=3373092 RepID=UPI0037534187
MTPKPHERLAAAIEDRRGELGLSLREVAELAGITGETLRAVRKGSNDPSPLTKRGIERALRWKAGSVEAILEGGEPRVATSGDARPGDLARLSARGTARFDSPSEVLANLPEDREARLRMLSALLDQMAEESERLGREQRQVMSEIARLLEAG